MMMGMPVVCSTLPNMLQSHLWQVECKAQCNMILFTISTNEHEAIALGPPVAVAPAPPVALAPAQAPASASAPAHPRQWI